MLLEMMKEKYLEYVKINLASRTYDCYISHLDYLYSYFFENKIVDSIQLNKEVLSSFVMFSKERNNTNRTINLRIQILKNMFRFNEVENISLFELKKLREDKNTFGVLTNVELDKVITYINSDALKFKNKVMLFLLIDTGIRINELLNIKICNINFYNNTIYLMNTKSHKPRSVPFSEHVGEILKSYINQFNLSDKLFEMTYNGCKAVFDRIKNKLNLNKFHPHMLRHTFASRLHKNGSTVFVIQKLLGHSSISVTQRYIHLDLEDLINDFHRTNVY